MDIKTRLRLDTPANYRIQVQGQLPERWSTWFGSMKMSIEGDTTVLTGYVADQPELHGLLSKIRDLGLPLLSVQHLEARTEQPVEI